MASDNARASPHANDEEDEVEECAELPFIRC
jgi:hypothetical protein